MKPALQQTSDDTSLFLSSLTEVYRNVQDPRDLCSSSPDQPVVSKAVCGMLRHTYVQAVSTALALPPQETS